MEQALIYVILVFWSIFLGLTLAIVLNKAWREGREASFRARRRRLEPKVVGYVTGDRESLVALLSPGGRSIGRGDRAVVEAVLLDIGQRLKGRSGERASQALLELGFVDRQLDRLSSDRWWKRADAAEKLSRAGIATAAAPLVATLEDPEPEVRIRAAKALGRLGGPAAVRALVGTLHVPDRWSTLRVADILTEMGGEAVEELQAEYPTLPRTGRLAVIDIHARLRPLESVPWLIDQLSDPLLDVRARACHALGRIGNPNAASALVRSMDDPSWEVRAMAARALGRCGRPDAIASLSVGLRDRHWWVRNNSAESLQQLGSPGIAALERMLAYPDRFAREGALQALERAGRVDERVDRLADEGPTGEEARVFVRRLVGMGALGRLQTLADDHPRPAVRLALTRLLPRELRPPREAA